MSYALTVPGIAQLLEAWDARRSCFGVEISNAEAMWNVLVTPPNTACTVQALHFAAQRLGLGWSEDTAQLVLATIAHKSHPKRISKAVWDTFWQSECAAWASRKPSRSAMGSPPKHGEWVDSDSESSTESAQMQSEDSRLRQLLQLGAAWQTTRAGAPQAAAIPAIPQHTPQASHGTQSLCSSADQPSPVRAPVAPAAAQADSPLGSVIFGLHSPEPHPVAEPASWIKSSSPGLGARARASQSSALKPRPVTRGLLSTMVGAAAGRPASFAAAAAATAARAPPNAGGVVSPKPDSRAQLSPTRRPRAKLQRSPRGASRTARTTPRHTSDTMATLSTVLSALLQDQGEAASLLRDAAGSPTASSEHTVSASSPVQMPASASAALSSPALLWMPSPSPRIAVPPGATPLASPARSDSSAVDALARAASMIQACLVAGTPEHLAAARELQAAALAASQALQAKRGGTPHGSVVSDTTSHTGGIMPPLASSVEIHCTGSEGHVLRSPFSALVASAAQHRNESQPSSDSIAAAAAAAFPPFACKPTSACGQLRVAQLPLQLAWVATQRTAGVQHTDEQPAAFEVAWHGSGAHAGGIAQFALSVLASSTRGTGPSPSAVPVPAFANTLAVALPSLELHPAAAAQAHETLCTPRQASEMGATVSTTVLDGAALAETHLVWQPLVFTARKWLAFIAVLECALHAKLGARVQSFVSLHDQHCDTPGSPKAEFSDLCLAQQYFAAAFQASASINAMRLAAAAVASGSGSSSTAASLLLAAVDRPECCSALSHALYAVTWTSPSAAKSPLCTRAVLLAGPAVGRELGAVARVTRSASRRALLGQYAPAAAGSAPDTLHCSAQLARMLYLQVVQCCASQQGSTMTMPWLQPVCAAPVWLHAAVYTADTIPLLLCQGFGDSHPLDPVSNTASQYGIAAEAVLPTSGLYAPQAEVPTRQVQLCPFHLLHFATGDAISALATLQVVGLNGSHALAASPPVAAAPAPAPPAGAAASPVSAPAPAVDPASPQAASNATGTWNMAELTAPSAGWDASQSARSRLTWHTPRPIISSGGGNAQQPTATSASAATESTQLCVEPCNADAEARQANEAAPVNATSQRARAAQQSHAGSDSGPAKHATPDWGLAQLCQLLVLSKAPKPSVAVARVRSSLVRAAALVGLPSGSPALSTVTLASALSAMAGPATDPLRIAAAVQAVAGTDQRVDVHDLCDALTVISAHAQAAGLRATASSPTSRSTATRSENWRPSSSRPPVVPAESKHPTGLQLPPHRAGYTAPPPLPTFGTISTPGTAFVAKAGLTRWEDELMALDAALAAEEAELSPAR